MAHTLTNVVTSIAPGILLGVFFGMARPFLDPVTAAKINFIYSSNDKSLEILEANFDLDELERGVGGRSDEAYDHLVYSARMLPRAACAATEWG